MVGIRENFELVPHFEVGDYGTEISNLSACGCHQKRTISIVRVEGEIIFK